LAVASGKESSAGAPKCSRATRSIVGVPTSCQAAKNMYQKIQVNAIKSKHP
jgi:hypothetical protein